MHVWFMFGLQAIESFWESVKDTDWFRHHPILSSPDLWSCVILHLFFGLFGASFNCQVVNFLICVLVIQMRGPNIKKGM